MYREALALLCIAWFLFIASVCAIGYNQLFIHYRKVPRRAAILSRNDDDIPHVTTVRPCKGLEPYLYECLAATLQQNYPGAKLTNYFCVSSKQDPAYPTIQRVLADHGNHDARLFVEEEDPRIQRGELGPNPKLRNMSRAYREAKGDIIWVIDCNVWVNPSACGRMVDKLCGYTHNLQQRQRPYKLVHHLPISIDVPPSAIDTPSHSQSDANLYDASTAPTLTQSLPSPPTSSPSFGGRLEELFLSSSHAKMYVAINTVAIAPCIVGKSTMFRRSHLDSLTQSPTPHASAPAGIDFFSHNICEDHLIGDLLWRSTLPYPSTDLEYKNHGLVLGDLAIQPVASMSVSNYIARRVRWLRVRKFTVPAATLVEPGTESMLCSALGVWGVTSSAYTQEWAANVAVSLVGGSQDKWGGCWVFLAWYLGSILIWSFVDWTTHILLHSGATIEAASQSVRVPAFVKPAQSPRASSASSASSQGRPSSGLPVVQRLKPGNLTPPLTLRLRRHWTDWAKAWLGRELLALPIWLWAIWGGVTVTWRERRFWVGWDMKVHEIVTSEESSTNDKGKGEEAPCGGAVSNGHGHAVMHTADGGVDRGNDAFFRRRRKGSFDDG